MWFGPEELFRQCVFLLDEEIIDYSQTPIPLICILRSSPAPVRLCSFELCNGKKKIPPHQKSNVYFHCCLEELEVFELQNQT